MSAANRRKLLEAADALAKTSQPDIEHYRAVAQSLAQVMTDDIGVECTVSVKMPANQLQQLLAQEGGAR